MPSSKGKRTDPKLAEEVKEEVKNEEKGGGKGSWSAWKAGEMAKRYEERGGEYENEDDSKNEPKKGAPTKKEGAEPGIHNGKKAGDAKSKAGKGGSKAKAGGSKAKAGGSKAKTGGKRKKADEEDEEEEDEAEDEPAEEEEAEEPEEEEEEEDEPPKKKAKGGKGKAAAKKAPAKKAAKSGGKKGNADQEIIDQFNEYVNMSADELKKWLEGDDSQGAGWTGGKGEGETVGHESGRKIVEILESNPDKDPEQYSSEQLAHMKKVNAYCKRHLAQEDKLKDSKSKEELAETKSTKSLKNWGHDPLKTM